MDKYREAVELVHVDKYFSYTVLNNADGAASPRHDLVSLNLEHHSWLNQE